MATDWAADVKKHVANADDAAIAGIVRYCGIALRNRDSALVSFSDKAETDRIRTNFLKKKLALTQADSVLDAAIAKAGAQMKADRTKNRVTVYYLLASEFKQLGQFIKTAPAAKKAPAAKIPVKTAAAKAVPAKAAPVKITPVKVTAKPVAKAKPAATAAVVAGAAAAAKAKPAKAAPAAKAAAAAKPALVKKPAPAKKAAAPGKNAAAPAKKVPAAAKATTAKAAAPANNATQGMLDQAASTASYTGKAAPKARPVAATNTPATATSTVIAASAADQPGTLLSGGSKPAAGSAASTSANAADDGSEMGWLWWVIGLAVLAFVAWFLFARGPDAPDLNGTEAAASAAASDVGTDLAAAPAEGSAAIPAGAGVTSEMRDGKPVLKVYFDTAMIAVTPDFAMTAGGLKAWLDSHSGSIAVISGYSDPAGDAEANAELANQRAQAVQTALVSAGIPVEAATLGKPEVSADAAVSQAAAGRVEVVVK